MYNTPQSTSQSKPFYLIFLLLQLSIDSKPVIKYCKDFTLVFLYNVNDLLSRPFNQYNVYIHSTTSG